MKHLVYIFFLCLFVLSCAPADNSKNDIALINKYVTAVEELNYAEIESLLDDNYLGLGPSHGDSISKSQVLSSLKTNFENLYQSIDYEKSMSIGVSIPDGENKGNWVSNWAELSITYKEDKSQVTILTNSVYKIENGKIVKSYSFYNEADVLDQLGYVFINPDDL